MATSEKPLGLSHSVDRLVQNVVVVSLRHSDRNSGQPFGPFRRGGDGLEHAVDAVAFDLLYESIAVRRCASGGPPFLRHGGRGSRYSRCLDSGSNRLLGPGGRLVRGVDQLGVGEVGETLECGLSNWSSRDATERSQQSSRQTQDLQCGALD